jgi:hypothetical protein
VVVPLRLLRGTELVTVQVVPEAAPSVPRG